MSVSVLDALKSCKEIPGVLAFFIMITPRIAEILLRFNSRNRSQSKAVVTKYSKEMSLDQWLLTAQGISFDVGGTLIDGQHRLQAVIESGQTVPMLVVYGLAAQSQEKVDRQKRRSLFDVFRLAGIEAVQKAIQIATFICKWNERRLYASAGALSDTEVRETLECHLESINAVLGCGHSKDKGLGRVGFLAAVVLYYEKDAEGAKSFYSSTLTGQMLTLDDPAMKLRKYLTGEGGYVKVGKNVAGGAPGQFIDCRKAIYAINAYHAGRKIAQLREADAFDF